MDKVMMSGKGYLTVVGVVVTYAGLLAEALGWIEVGGVIKELGIAVSGLGAIRKGVAGV